MAVSSFNLDADRTKVQSGIVDVTGVSGAWVYQTVTFPTPYKSTPLVTVNAPYSTGSATNWNMPMIDQLTSTGFRFGWYSVNGSKQAIWQAIGNI